MLLYAAVIAMWIQAAPAAKPAAKASVAGVVVNTNGEPIPNVRVSLGKLNVNLGAFTQLMTFDRPTVETTLPAELFRTIGDQLANEVAAGGIPPEEAAAAAAFKSIPVDDIHEIVASPNGSVAVIPKSMPPVMTDDRGRFAFPDVEPGTYRLMFAASGYAKQDYGQRTGAGGVPITLSPGQSKTDIVMRLLAVAAVSGHIRDARGEAVAGVPVQLFRFVYDASGQRQVQPVATTQSNDRGDYRMYYLSPGRYYVRAGNQPGEQPRRSGVESLLFGGGYSTANRIAQNYLLTYYPGVGDENSAAPLDVQPGADLRGVDFFLSLQQSYRVRGRVVDSRTGQPPPSATVTLYLQNPDPLSGGGFVGGNAGYRPADGTFEVQNVGAGRYNISATIPSPPQQRPPDLANMTPAERNAYVQCRQ
jgi:hypothetical protein